MAFTRGHYYRHDDPRWPAAVRAVAADVGRIVDAAGDPAITWTVTDTTVAVHHPDCESAAVTTKAHAQRIIEKFQRPGVVGWDWGFAKVMDRESAYDNAAMVLLIRTCALAGEEVAAVGVDGEPTGAARALYRTVFGEDAPESVFLPPEQD